MKKSIGFIALVSIALCIVTTAVFASQSQQWGLANSHFQSRLYGVNHVNGQFIAAGQHGVVLVSSDGTNWVHRDILDNSEPHSVVANSSIYVAAAGYIYWSTDLLQWHRVDDSPVGVVDVVWDGTAFIAVGSYGKILRSEDGAVWEALASPTSDHLRSIAWNGQYYVAVGNWTTIVHSSNGIDWYVAVVGLTIGDDFRDVAWGGGVFVTVGRSGTVATCTNPAIWTQSYVGGFPYDFEALEGVSWTGVEFVAAGRGGLHRNEPRWMGVDIKREADVSRSLRCGKQRSNGGGCRRLWRVAVVWFGRIVGSSLDDRVSFEGHSVDGTTLCATRDYSLEALHQLPDSQQRRIDVGANAVFSCWRVP